jgi:hypothetical protein
MSVQKVDSLIIGKGAINSNAQSAQIFASTLAVGVYSASTSYVDQACVEYSGAIYRSIGGSNLGNTPSSSPTVWEVIIKTIQDGDACFVVNSGNSDLQIRLNGVWSSFGGKPYSLSLNDNQTSPIAAFSYPGSAMPYAILEVRVRRNNGFSSAKVYTYNVVTDGSNVQYSSSGVDLGVDTGVTFTVAIVTGQVQFQYTSTNLGQSIQLDYSIKGF